MVCVPDFGEKCLPFLGFQAGLIMELGQMRTHPRSAFLPEDLFSNWGGATAATERAMVRNRVSLGSAVMSLLRRLNITLYTRAEAEENLATCSANG